MAYEYLKDLDVSDEDKEKLRVLGAASPAVLLSRIQYSPEARQRLVDYLGDEAKVCSLESGLRSLTVEKQGEPLPPFNPGLGALDPGKNESANPQIQREGLIREVQNLRSSGAYGEAEQKAAELRETLKQG